MKQNGLKQINKRTKSDQVAFFLCPTTHPPQMTDSIQPPVNPLQTNRALYSKYSSSQTYYYSNVIAEIVKEKRTTTNINYEDTQYLCDSQQYLKRFYMDHEFNTKMFTFKEYYFYHEDCPRIYMKYIEELYSKWQDRRRDLVYKKLKILYNESFSSSRTSSKEEDNPSASGITHFLLEISDYNPFSKKYYLRVEAKDKEKLQEKEKDKNKTVKDLSSLNHDLSVMLNDMSQLSNISTLQQQESPRFSTLYHSKKLKINYSSETSTHHNSQSNSNIHSSIKFNFKKNKNSSRDNLKIAEQFQRKIQLRDKSNSQLKDQRSHETQGNYPARLSPKFADNKTDDKDFKQNYTKSKSIIQLSNFNPNRRSQMVLNLNSNKKDNLKIKSDKKPASRQNRITLENKALKVYDSEKKAITQIQSHKKMPQVIVIDHDKITVQTLHEKGAYQSLGKKSSTILPSTSNTPLKPLPRKGSLRQQITPLSKEKANEFSDNKFQKSGEVRFRSHKSEYFSLSKQNLLNRANSPSKVSIKGDDKKYPKKEKVQIQINRKGHQLKIQ